MFERLVETWLDSASERSYQTPFCQMLVGRGHKVLHSTRHSSIEFGKDVVTIDPEGVPCAFQLKGNPGGRLTLHAYNEILPQLYQLAVQPLTLPGVRATQHRSLLVTNGLVEEEVRTAISQTNDGLRDAPGGPIEVLQRGDLLSWAGELGTALWPSELEDADQLLRLLVAEGRESIPNEHLHRLLARTLFVDQDTRRLKSASAVARHVSAAAILVAVAMRNFSVAENYVAEIGAWTAYMAYAVATCDKHGVSAERNAGAPLRIALDSILDLLTDLATEIRQRQDYTQGMVMGDAPFLRPRLTLLAGLLSIYWFWRSEVGWNDPEERSDVKQFLMSAMRNLELWGEAAVPQFVALSWFMRHEVSSSAADSILTRVASDIVRRNAPRSTTAFASPHYHYEDVFVHAARDVLTYEADPLEGQTFAGASSTVDGLFCLLAKAGLKQTCKLLWPDVSKLRFKEFEHEHPWQALLWHCERGTDVDLVLPLEAQYSQIEDRVREQGGSALAHHLAGDRYFNALHLLFFPHRCSTRALLRADAQFSGVDFVGPGSE